MRIEHQCPQCGGPVTLEETDRLLECTFCRTRLYVRPKDRFRYCLAPLPQREEETIFVPYWRFRGMHFLCRKSGVQKGIIDRTVSAVTAAPIPPTLGIRPQAMKLRFAQKTGNARFIEPQLPFSKSAVRTDESVFSGFDMMRDTASGTIFAGSLFSDALFGQTDLPATPRQDNRIYYESFIAETVSTVYAPVFVKDGTLHDGITDMPLPGAFDEHSLAGAASPEDWSPRFLPTLCPNCGWDLIAEKDSCILLCNRCNSAWQALGSAMERTPYGTVIAEKTRRKVCYLPFWKIKVAAEGIELGSYGDLVRFANLPKAMKAQWEEAGLSLWTPAFKIAPALFLRLARQLSISNPNAELEEVIPEADLCAVNLPLSEAVEGLKVLVADMAVKKGEVIPRLPETAISATESLLVFYPFVDSGYELAQPEIPCSIMKNALRWGKNL